MAFRIGAERVTGPWRGQEELLGLVVDMAQHCAQQYLAEKNVVPWLNLPVFTDPKYGTVIKNYDLTSPAADLVVWIMGHIVKRAGIKGLGSYATLFRALQTSRKGIVTAASPHSSPSNPSSNPSPPPQQFTAAPINRGTVGVPVMY